MRAMVLEHIRSPLQPRDLPIPSPSQNQILVKIHVCGVCRTDLHIVDGDLKQPKLPLILGHEIVGTVASESKRFKKGERIGIPWLGKSCQHCRFCCNHEENLCDNALFTGYTINGGFAEYCVVDENYAFPLPYKISDEQIAPLLCAGFIGYRSYSMIKNAQKIGFYGFGVSAHILVQIAHHQKKEIFAFTRKGDAEGQKFALSLGAKWAGHSEQTPPEVLDAAILFAPVGSLVPTALKAVRKGGVVVCSGIYMSDIPSFPYSLLWGERVLRSVTNLTRHDGEEFLSLLSKISIHPHVTTYPLEKANEAIRDFKEGKLTGAAVLKIG